MIVDARQLPDARRLGFAAAIKQAYDFELPELKYWNYGLCRKHRFGWEEISYDQATQRDISTTVTDRPAPGCRNCGLHFRRHQRVGVAWLYFKKKALLADSVGTGKTAHSGGVLALLRETGELSFEHNSLTGQGRAIVVCRAPAIGQWATELARMVPLITVVTADGTRERRLERYNSAWEVLVTSPQTLINDLAVVRRLGIEHVFVDDVDALRHRDTRTAHAIKQLARQAARFVVLTGTPLQKKLHELHSVLECMGGFEVFGSESSFLRRYVRSELVTIYDQKTGRKRTVSQVVGSKNIAEFKQLVAPMALRRTASDIDDVHLPEIIPSNVWLELYPEQKRRYDLLRKDVLKIMKESGVETRTVTALTKVGYGARICSGLPALGEPDGPGASSKLDWVLEKLSDGGDLEDEKVVIFAMMKDTIRALQARLTAAGIGFETIWGEDNNRAHRQASQARFWDDPKCRVLMGTTSIEQSLNLQVARHLINVDMIMNPARMEQLAGRIRRDGSAYKHVFVHNLLTLHTQEERVLPHLEREQALIDAVWDEESSLFQRMSPLALMALITG